MKILLIQPSFKKNTFLYRLAHKICLDPSYALQYLAALIPKKYDVKVVNENNCKINFDEDVDIVGISCITSNALRGYEIADEFRKRGKTVILGGYHPTALPEEAKRHADSVVIGDSEEIWPILLKDVEKNNLKNFYKMDFPPKSISPLRRELFREIYLYAPIETSKGCVNKCRFCAITHIKKYYIRRPLGEVLEEIKNIKHKIIHFHDPSLVSDVEYARILFKKLKELDKKFFCQGTVDVLAKNEDLLKLSRDAGCISWNVGLETISQINIDEIHKTSNIVTQYKYVIKKIKEYGMEASGGIIFGFDNDKPNVFSKTLELLYEWDIDTVGFHILTPFPGTPLFQRFEKEGRILTRDWSKYDLEHVVFKPKNLTPEELREGMRWINKEFYSISNLSRRFFSFHKLNFYPYFHLMGTWFPATLFNPFI